MESSTKGQKRRSFGGRRGVSTAPSEERSGGTPSEQACGQPLKRRSFGGCRADQARSSKESTRDVHRAQLCAIDGGNQEYSEGVTLPLDDNQHEVHDMEAEDTSSLTGATGDAANMACTRPGGGVFPQFMRMFGDLYAQSSVGV